LEILVGPSNSNEKASYLSELSQTSNNQFVFKHIRALYPRFTFDQLTGHPAVVLFPYAAMSYSIVDFYAINMPIFVPSIEFSIKLKTIGDRTLQSNYCKKMPDPITFDRQLENNLSTTHPFSPNSDKYSALKYWLQFADYYVWPFVTVFDSFEDLMEKLKEADLPGISRKMKAHNLVRETDLLNNWCRLTKAIAKSPKTPASYEQALAYYNVTSFSNNGVMVGRQNLFSMLLWILFLIIFL